ncbi:hypothetical protein UY3_18969 [Chelonia mydas]|uniref:Uncharacterized protein n=1 Tax=Chelonia mydas TaxID=8469 RepID=M7AMS6_CHEMY|nr:hypothetical protein UY3_18969 [Chelonia mydas]
MASDLKSGVPPRPTSEAVTAEVIRMQKLADKKQREHEKEMLELRLREKTKQKITERKKEAEEREKAVHQRCMEQLQAEREAHQKKLPTFSSKSWKSKRICHSLKLHLPSTIAKIERGFCVIYKDTEDREEFLSTFEHLWSLHKFQMSSECLSCYPD